MAARTPDADILAAAWKVATLYGFHAVTRPKIAPLLGISQSGISSYNGGMAGVLRDVVDRAIAERNVGLIAQAIAAGHPGALAAPVELRELAARHLAGVG